MCDSKSWASRSVSFVASTEIAVWCFEKLVRKWLLAISDSNLIEVAKITKYLRILFSLVCTFEVFNISTLIIWYH